MLNYEMKYKNKIDELGKYGFRKHPYQNLVIPYGLTIKKGNGVLDFYVYSDGKFNLEISKYDGDCMPDIIEEFDEILGKLIVAGIVEEVYDDEIEETSEDEFNYFDNNKDRLYYGVD